MPKPRLHLDADTSNKSLYEVLVEHGHDVTRTPTDWMTLDCSSPPRKVGHSLNSLSHWIEC